MKVLLDENIPEELKADLSAHEVYSIREMGWKGKKNGELIQNLVKERFEILLTADKNMQYQQNLKKIPIVLIVLKVKMNIYPVIQLMVPNILRALKQRPKEGIIIIE